MINIKSIVFAIFVVISFISSICAIFYEKPYKHKENYFWVKLSIGILASLISFFVINLFQRQNALRNEPLLLKNKINISINSAPNNKIKVNVNIPINKQGMISEAYLLYFKNGDDNVSQIIPLNFNNENSDQLNASVNLNSHRENLNLHKYGNKTYDLSSDAPMSIIGTN